MKILNFPIYSTGKDYQVKVTDQIYQKSSYFQNISIFESPNYGKCLLIDGIMQAAESDHKIYDEAILRELKKEDRNILILGGGDGYVAEGALKINQDLKINVIDLDMEVVKSCEEFLNQKVFRDSRIKLYIEDALAYLNEAVKQNEKFDGVVVDLTDEPEKGSTLVDFKMFYEEILTLAKNILKDNGWVSMQAGAAQTTPDYFNAVSVLEKVLLEKGFQDILRNDVLIPSFGEKNAFLYAKK